MRVVVVGLDVVTVVAPVVGVVAVDAGVDDDVIVDGRKMVRGSFFSFSASMSSFLPKISWLSTSFRVSRNFG